MSWITILFLISVIVNLVITYILHNSQWDKYSIKGESLKFPLIVWILLWIPTFIPILNVVGSFIYIILACLSYSSGDICLKKNFWLAKEI